MTAGQTTPCEKPNEFKIARFRRDRRTDYEVFGAGAPNPATGKKRPYWFSVPSRPIFAFAGIWRPTEVAPVFSFLTTGYDGDPAAHAMGAIHPKACPVILHEEDHERWLRTAPAHRLY